MRIVETPKLTDARSQEWNGQTVSYSGYSGSRSIGFPYAVMDGKDSTFKMDGDYVSISFSKGIEADGIITQTSHMKNMSFPHNHTALSNKHYQAADFCSALRIYSGSVGLSMM